MCQIQNGTQAHRSLQSVARMSTSETSTAATDATDAASTSTSMRSLTQHKECNFSTQEDGAGEDLFPALFEWSQTGTTIGITGSFNKYVRVCMYMRVLAHTHMRKSRAGVLLSANADCCRASCFPFYSPCRAAGARRFC